ncbi:MAG: polymer-forming cytoskeletal protein [Candidatus Eisenbacteria bacterium]|nr:polymer-forming cytoskeletal protein [Candidatus Eisenbacteria bacterium]
MFGKDVKDKPEEAGLAPTEKGSGLNTFLGPGTKYTGKLDGSGSVQIDGNFDGEIVVRGTLLVGREGVVKAKVGAHQVVVHGRLEGEIDAGSKVELMGGSTFLGSVSSPSFVIQERAQFEGTCRMPRREESSVPGKPR